MSGCTRIGKSSAGQQIAKPLGSARLRTDVQYMPPPCGTGTDRIERAASKIAIFVVVIVYRYTRRSNSLTREVVMASGGKESNEPIFANVTRYTTPEERAKVERIDLDPKDIDEFMELLKKGLVEAAGAHDAAVQNNIALSAEVSVRLSRPVYNEKLNLVEELVGTSTVKSALSASKIYKK
jgi:hypothetical protein